jgi:UDP-N-acetylglucosamine:LPS N-acetylglucosamine transferase
MDQWVSILAEEDFADLVCNVVDVFVVGGAMGALIVVFASQLPEAVQVLDDRRYVVKPVQLWAIQHDPR